MTASNGHKYFQFQDIIGSGTYANMAALQRPHGRVKEPPEDSAAREASFMTPQQLDRYLYDLRNNRPARPSGARPLGNPQATDGVAPLRDQPAEQGRQASVRGGLSDTRKRLSTASRHSIAGHPSHRTSGSHTPGSYQSVETRSAAPYHIPYYERGQRWMERQEAHSLSRALQDMDKDEDARIYTAAQQEAAQLVWKHQNPNTAYHNPDYDYRQHLRKGSHARSQSIGPFKELYVQRRVSTEELAQVNEGTRKVSSGSNGTQSTSSTGSRSVSRYSFSGSLRERAMNSLPLNITKARNVAGRRMSGFGSRKPSDKSGKAPFQNPEDKIYEETTNDVVEAPSANHEPSGPLRVRPRNTSYGKPSSELGSGVKPKLGGPRALPGPLVSKQEGYSLHQAAAHDPVADAPRLKNGLEIRNDEIRAATSMKKKDRSAKLPQPSAVSDVLGRPIVSFDPEYRPPKKEAKTVPTRGGSRPIDVTSDRPKNPPIPAIQIDNVPAIAVTPDADIPRSVPSINVDSVDSSQNMAQNAAARARPRPQPKLPPRSNTHWSLAGHAARPQAQCSACALGIQGKIVSAANQRFHPECFACYQCGELLECVAFYPEPDQARAERLLRYESHMRASGSGGDENDGDFGLRFFCHLDFHEKFSPRCKNCKTPIEGKVVVACGAEWHEGHFFCAECGDPFDQHTPFIEKEGYAWCVPCHTRRYSGKCASCRKPITDMVVNALGKEWHEECFRCSECGSQFEGGKFFTSSEEESPICVKCEERRLKA